MKFVNGWNYTHKDNDRFELHLRVSFLTLIKVYIDISSRRWEFTLLNFRLEL